MDFGDLEQLQASYRREATDLLADLGDALLLLEHDPQNIELVNRVFRAMHTLKGSGASAGFRRLAGFVHHVEEVFNRIRSHQLETNPELIDATLKACDCCVMLLELGSSTSDTPLPLETEVLNAIRPFLPNMDDGKAKIKGAKEGPPARYTIGFRPNREIFFSGTDPASLLLDLNDLGPIEIRCDTRELLACEDFDPEQCYLHWKVSLKTSKSDEVVRDVFRFLEDECDITIERHDLALSVKSPTQDSRFLDAVDQCFEALGFALEQYQTGPEPEDPKLGVSSARRAAQTLMFTCKASQHHPATEAARKIFELIPKAQPGEPIPEGWLDGVREAIEAAQAAVIGPATAVVAVTAQSAAAPTDGTPIADGAVSGQSIRVDSSKLDALMRLAGEMLVARGALPSFAERIERESGGKDAAAKSLAKEMRDAGAKVSRLADDLQATVMSIRMLPVRQVFQRFPRLVRDLARNLDKNIELHVHGEETELDKTVIDSIGDPLTHIIRNAGDHGIESKADRLAQGKPEAGRIDLSAYTRGSNVVIEIKDDGKGLDPEKLKRRAVEKGLYTEAAAAAMDEETAFKIILAAGFSTVDKVTDLSGRGVGMDVVRNSVEALHGAIHIQSVVGKGTTFRIELPASLLVSKGILAAVGGQQVVLPMETIRNMVKLPSSVLRTVQGQQIAHVRGDVVPILSLAHALCFSEDRAFKEEISLAIIDAASGPYGLIVDRFLGELEVVVKPLAGVLAQVPEYIGAAIMGNGKTVLVANTEKLFTLQATAAGLSQGIAVH